jgi:hypothetical protein
MYRWQPIEGWPSADWQLFHHHAVLGLVTSPENATTFDGRVIVSIFAFHCLYSDITSIWEAAKRLSVIMEETSLCMHSKNRNVFHPFSNHMQLSYDSSNINNTTEKTRPTAS